MKELTIDAKLDNLSQVMAFVDEALEDEDCSMKAQMQIDIAVEEIFVNIAKYAYEPKAGSATIRMDTHSVPDTAVITFIDSGKPFNPLKVKAPDVTLAAHEREIGGLGIFMVRKSMDEVAYDYADNRNIFTIKKKIK